MSDPRLSAAGNRVSRQLAALLEQLARMETWLSQRGRSELSPQDRELLAGSFVRLGRVGKSHIIQAVGQQSCALGWRVRYTTSADLLLDLRASLADQTLPARVRYYARLDLLIIDEFGFERLERLEAPQAASLLYKVIDARYQQHSTALVTNVDSQLWPQYLGDEQLAQALFDRLVDGAIVIRIAGKSYRAHRSRDEKATRAPTRDSLRNRPRDTTLPAKVASFLAATDREQC